MIKNVSIQLTIDVKAEIDIFNPKVLAVKPVDDVLESVIDINDKDLQCFTLEERKQVKENITAVILKIISTKFVEQYNKKYFPHHT